MSYFMGNFSWNYVLVNQKLLMLILVTKKGFLDFSPLLTLSTLFYLYLSTPITLAELCQHPSPFTSPEMLLNMTKVDETDCSLHAFE